MNASFGDIIRVMREERKLPLRKVAAMLDIDQSTLSKIERGKRTANRDMAIQASKIFDVDVEELLILLLSDRIANELKEEKDIQKVFEVAERKIIYYRNSKLEQKKLFNTDE